MSEQKTKQIEDELAERLKPLGLSVFGWFRLRDEDLLGDYQRELAAGMGASVGGVLIGNHAADGVHRMWDVFNASQEYSDGMPDPMDRWAQRVIAPLAAELNGEVIFPFGETLWPFQRFAKQASAMQPSPLGLLIHPQHGLWQAFRTAILFRNIDAFPTRAPIEHPCDTCVDKPCLSACPVDAFSGQGFAVADCRAHLSRGEEPNCMADGCRARAACPIGTPYSQAQTQFHMKAFSGR